MLTLLSRQLFYPLLATLIIELPLSLLFWRDRSALSRLAAVAALDLVTNPLLNLFLFALTSPTRPFALLLVSGELLVWLVEAAGLSLLLEKPFRSGLCLSAILNGTSVILGLLLGPLLRLSGIFG